MSRSRDEPTAADGGGCGCVCGHGEGDAARRAGGSDVYRINLDGTGLTLLTSENADHAVSFSPDGKYFVDVFSRVDLPTRSVIRNTEDGRIVAEVEKADVSRLTAMGWRF